ncbi:MAG: hypothetical protein Q8P27_02470 [Candidatus Peregrinibacteria bacterium]|nr:hypothetical protein [Candidatus Peregrinibacteria bacterium]
MANVYAKLLRFQGLNSDEIMDVPVAGVEFILGKNHPAFDRAMACKTVEEMVDFLTRSCLKGRCLMEDPDAFTHATPEAAMALAKHARELDLPVVEAMILDSTNDQVRLQQGTPRIYPGSIVAIIPTPNNERQPSLMWISDPRRGAPEFAPSRDPFASIVNYGTHGYMDEATKARLGARIGFVNAGVTQ